LLREQNPIEREKLEAIYENEREEASKEIYYYNQ